MDLEELTRAGDLVSGLRRSRFRVDVDVDGGIRCRVGTCEREKECTSAAATIIKRYSQCLSQQPEPHDHRPSMWKAR